MLPSHWPSEELYKNLVHLSPSPLPSKHASLPGSQQNLVAVTKVTVHVISLSQRKLSNSCSNIIALNLLYHVLTSRSNCDSSAANELRKHYRMPYFLPETSESSKTDWLFMGCPGYGAHLHVSTLIQVFTWTMHSCVLCTSV